MTLDKLRAAHADIGSLDLLSEEGHAEAERRHRAYFDALGTALGYEKSDTGTWVDPEGLAPNVAMMEARFASQA